MSVQSVHAQAQGSFQGGSWLDAYVIIQQSVTPIGGGGNGGGNSLFYTGGQFGTNGVGVPSSAHPFVNLPSNLNSPDLVNQASNLNSPDLVNQNAFTEGATNGVANPNQLSSQPSSTITSTIPNNSGSCPTKFVTVLDILLFLKCIISVSIIPLLFAIAISVFVWGIIKYIRNAEDSKKREEGRNFMIYGIVSIFVIVSMWGLVGFLRNTFFPNSAGQIFIPAPRTQSPQ